MSFQKAKNLSNVNRNLQLIVRLAINYPFSVLKLSSLSLALDGLVEMNCNLKQVWLTFFKFSHFRLQRVLEQMMSCSFQEFS